MAADGKRTMPTLRLNRAGSNRSADHPVPVVLERVPERSVAPDWNSPTIDNGVAEPRGILHIALVIPDAQAFNTLAKRVYVVKPPLWKGEVRLHAIPEPGKNDADITLYIKLALIDLGLIDSKDVQIDRASIELGYPSGDPV